METQHILNNGVVNLIPYTTEIEKEGKSQEMDRMTDGTIFKKKTKKRREKRIAYLFYLFYFTLNCENLNLYGFSVFYHGCFSEFLPSRLYIYFIR